jgi:hypothetical protein
MLTSLSFVSCQSKTRSNLEQRKVSDDDWMEKRKKAKGIPSSCVQAHRSKKKASKKGFSFSQTIAGSSSSRMVVACVLKENGLRM